MTLGEKIQSYRKNSNLSQEKLAELINVSRQAISKWESDQAMPDLVNIVALSKVFHVSCDDLLNTDSLTHSQINTKPSNDFEYLISKIKRHWYKIGYLMIGYGGYKLVGLFLFTLISNQMNQSFQNSFTSGFKDIFDIQGELFPTTVSKTTQLVTMIPLTIYIVMILLGFLLLFLEHKKYSKKKLA